MMFDYKTFLGNLTVLCHILPLVWCDTNFIDCTFKHVHLTGLLGCGVKDVCEASLI